MNIVIGKLGRSISSNSNKWSATGGDNEPFIIFDSLARSFPEHTFYMIGKSDFFRNKYYNRPSNIINLWDSFKSKSYKHLPILEGYKEQEKDEHKYIEKKIEELKSSNIKLDFGIIMAGPVSSINFSDKGLKKTDGSNEFAKTINIVKFYVSSLYEFLNETKTPWVCLGPDPRYFNFGKDLFNPPKKIISQYNGKTTYKRFVSFKDQSLVEVTIPIEYKGFEKTFLIGRKKPVQIKKTKRMTIVLNEGGNKGLLRGPMLKEFILDHFEDVDVFGKWSDEWMKDPRFKGPKMFNDLQPFLYNAKYTFIIPIQKGWTTAKIWEMIYYGIIPFMHPYYDSQRNLDVPEILRVSNPQELKERIDFLENNPDEYEYLLSSLYNLIEEEDLDGSNLLNNIMEEGYNIIGKTYKRKKFIKQENKSFFRMIGT